MKLLISFKDFSELTDYMNFLQGVNLQLHLLNVPDVACKVILRIAWKFLAQVHSQLVSIHHSPKFQQELITS